jgi:hypothetical protein
VGAWSRSVAKGRRVLLCNPATGETGLNCLTHLCTLVWFQPPDCDPRAKRQAEGRLYRVGQTRPVRIHWLIYKGTSQEVLHRLLLLKVAESEAVDGLDPTSALLASGVGAPVGMTWFDLRRAIFAGVETEEKAPAVRVVPDLVESVAVRSAIAAPAIHGPDLMATPTPIEATSTPALAPPAEAARVPAPSAPLPPAPEPALPALASRIVERRIGRSQRAAQLAWAW